MLSERDQIFCERCASGLMAYEAYIEAGFRCTSNESAQAAASRKLKEPGIREEVARIRGELHSAHCLELVEKRLLLAEIAKGRAVVAGREDLFEVLPSHADRMRAIDLDNKMMGDYAPERRDVSLQGSFFEDLFDYGSGVISENVDVVEGASGKPGLAS